MALAARMAWQSVGERGRLIVSLRDQSGRGAVDSHDQASMLYGHDTPFELAVAVLAACESPSKEEK